MSAPLPVRADIATSPTPSIPPGTSPSSPALGSAGFGWTRIDRSAIGLVALALAVIYLLTYTTDPATPGNNTRFPLGWWGWWDQSQYIRSARAFAVHLLDPEQHWYPLGYSLLLSLFARGSGGHAALLPDLLCLLLAFAGFCRFATRVGVRPAWGAPLFLLGTEGSQSVRGLWAEPWNSTLSAALLWWLLSLTADLLRDRGPAAASGRKPAALLFALGVLAVLVCFTRPTDALIVGIWGLLLLWFGLRSGSFRILGVGWLAAGGVLAAVPLLWLWIAVYGFRLSPYMMWSRSLGFSLHGLWWKSYLLLVAPAPWFPGDRSLLERLPWLFPGIAAMTVLPLIVAGRARMLLAMLSLMIVPYSLLFFSYVDLVPSGLWRFHNAHYFKWTFPGLLLLGAVLLRAVAFGPRRAPVAALAVLSLLSCIRLVPRAAHGDAPVWMAQHAMPVAGWSPEHESELGLRDAAGMHHNIHDIRILPGDDGWRAIGMAAPLHGALSPVSPSGSVGAPWSGEPRWTMRFHLGAPAWLGTWSPHLPRP
ncbi:hypothetical protein [Rhizosaccharibacter radicis]|uniref:Glycosyltransferase RgtA/B/C/D-like domain-containing protein n=1 Tax=Rhizosaccharibacter radicis TaxID=2782605 RepID=A0ABT1W319_9PROT|nr:hypothetical protein [Acetobacteraceae bacterium KSS12]